MPLLKSEYILKSLNKLDVRQSTGTDKIGPILWKLGAPFITESLTYICNLSIKTSTFPEKRKESKLNPLHKGDRSNDLNNFRSISILPVLSKLFEKHVHDSLMNYLGRYKRLYNTQSGFRPKHFCKIALFRMVKIIKQRRTGWC